MTLFQNAPAAKVPDLLGHVFFGVVLISGPIWARYAWGTFWVWDARLTTSLILELLYVSYLILRNSSEVGS